MRKALSDEHGQHVMETAKELAGTYGLLTDTGPFGEPDTQGWHYGYLYARALTIGGGTSEVQRNILGEKVLGLPARSRVNVPPGLRERLAAAAADTPDTDCPCEEIRSWNGWRCSRGRCDHGAARRRRGGDVPPRGRAFAAAYGGRILVRTTGARATLAAERIATPRLGRDRPVPGRHRVRARDDVLRDLLARGFTDAARRP